MIAPASPLNPSRARRAPPKAGSWRKRLANQVRSRSRSGTVGFRKSAPIRGAAIHAALRVRWRRAEPFASGVARAADQVVVHHADRLHKGVDDRRAAELEAPSFEFLGNLARQLRLGGHLAHCLVAIDDRLATGEVP